MLRAVLILCGAGLPDAAWGFKAAPAVPTLSHGAMGDSACGLGAGRKRAAAGEAAARSRSSTPRCSSNRLFEDLQAASARRAEVERELLEKNTREMTPPSTKRMRGAGGGGGFGKGSSKALTAADKVKEVRLQALKEDGVVLIRGGLQPATAQKLRECVFDEIEEAREAVRQDPAVSVSRFHVPHEQPTRAFTLLPLRDAASIQGGVDGPIVTAIRELLAPGAELGELYATLCGGEDAQLYDFYALRTEPGCVRQQVHSDTPFQKIPPLFAAFVSLQDVHPAMGPTMFIPGSHTKSAGRLQFDNGLYDGSRDKMLGKAKSKYALLKCGDLVLFDMRTLHAGTTNLADTGATRIFLCITFRNPNANAVDLGHKPCIRPGFSRRFTLSDVRAELAGEDPFALLGDGLPVTAQSTEVEQPATAA